MDMQLERIQEPHVNQLLPSERFWRLRVAILSDAITGRNGVGTYYPDLIGTLNPHVDAMELIAPEIQSNPRLDRWAMSMPGDRTQRMVWPHENYLRRRLKSFQPSVVVLPSMGAITYYGLRLAQELSIPIAVVNHTSFDQLLPFYFGWPLSTIGTSFFKSVNRWLLRQADGVAIVSREAFEGARRAGIDKVRIVGTPIARQFHERRCLPVANEIRRIVYVGRLAPEKNVEALVAAAKRLPHLHFDIIGDGPLRKRLEHSSNNLQNLTFHGWKDRETVCTMIDQGEMLVLPSRLETFGTVALEALARQRFVLASHGCGITKWPSLASGLFTVGKDETVAEAIARVAGMAHLRRVRQAESGWAAVQQFHQNTLRVWLAFLSDTAGCCVGNVPEKVA